MIITGQNTMSVFNALSKPKKPKKKDLTTSQFLKKLDIFEKKSRKSNIMIGANKIKRG